MGLVWECIRGGCVYTSAPRLFHYPRAELVAAYLRYPFEKLHVNDQTRISLRVALHCSSRDWSLSSHVAFQRNMKLLSHWGKSKSCSAAVLWAALCGIALETGLIGMCGPNSPHCLKLAGFMFTTIGFGIAALDCLCFAVGVCVCMRHQVCEANSTRFSVYHIRMHDSCNCLMSLVANSVNHVFLKVVGGCGLRQKMEGFEMNN